MAWDPRVGPVVPASSDPAPMPNSPGSVPPRPWSAPAGDSPADTSPDFPPRPDMDQEAPIMAPFPGGSGAVDSAFSPPVLTPGRPLEPLHGSFGPAAADAPPWSTPPGVTIVPPKRTAPDWGETSLGISASTAAGVSYLGWWLSGLLIYFNERHNWYVRFHALQSILFTGALTVVSVAGYVVSSLLMDLFMTTHQPVFRTLSVGLAAAILLAVVAAWLTPLIAAWSGIRLRIPYLASYAERYAAPFIAEPTTPHAGSPSHPDHTQGIQ